MPRRRGQKAPSPVPSGLAAVNGAYPANGGASPQAWNGYAYVANQPLTAADPLVLAVPCGGMFGGPCGGALAGPTPGHTQRVVHNGRRQTLPTLLAIMSWSGEAITASVGGFIVANLFLFALAPRHAACFVAWWARGSPRWRVSPRAAEPIARLMSGLAAAAASFILYAALLGAPPGRAAGAPRGVQAALFMLGGVLVTSLAAILGLLWAATPAVFWDIQRDWFNNRQAADRDWRRRNSGVGPRIAGAAICAFAVFMGAAFARALICALGHLRR